MPAVDAALLVSAVSGDQAATDALLALLRPDVLRYCRARLGDRRHRASDADDCAQEVLIGVLGALPGYRSGAGEFLGFVYRVAAHKVVDARRRDGADVSVPVPELGPVLCGGPGPLCHVENLERRQRLHLVLDLLAPQQRDVVVLRVMLGLTAEDTAAVLGVASPGAVRVSQHRALAALRRHLATQAEL
ncbi:sigma-70 family RNA polymerase sigma factor [Amycolatopsis sp. NPDC048633]|uniref:sigma-70 family RNA polymerase sigma factor n=1 Tax=Amycolatopsis sp. NPDC048633 TaxID=3157095 RepID=UPI0033D7637D